MFEQTFKNIDDVLWKDPGCDSELDYIGQTSWILFLRYLDELERDKADEAELKGEDYKFILDEKYRWNNWAMPKGEDDKLDHHLMGMFEVPFYEKKALGHTGGIDGFQANAFHFSEQNFSSLLWIVYTWVFFRNSRRYRNFLKTNCVWWI